MAWTSGCGVGASASSTIRTSDAVWLGTPVQLSGGEIPLPSAVYWAGIGA